MNESSWQHGAKKLKRIKKIKINRKKSFKNDLL